jgi:redox-sensitive bicupin YhaK (pirin superfamily)
MFWKLPTVIKVLACILLLVHITYSETHYQHHNTQTPEMRRAGAVSTGLRVRRARDRGHADHGWLDSWHTFSFADYYDPRFNGYRSLRVINEDRVAGGGGFPTHPHRNFEIFSYVISGALEHKDSLDNREVLKRGDVQFTSAGSGIRHSEYNHSKKEIVHFLQCWLIPNEQGLRPSYQTRFFSDEDKQGQLCPIISPKQNSPVGTDEADNPHITQKKEREPIQANQDAWVYASILNKGQTVEHKIKEGRGVYIHVCDLEEAGLKVNDEVVLGRGDGLFVEDTTTLNLSGEGQRTEFLLFDLA